jgi:DNA polymerase III delta subunit
MKWDEFAKSLRAGKLSSVYLFVGDDRYLKTKSLEYLTSALFPRGKGEVVRYEAPGGTADAVRDAQTYPFFTARRLIVLENAEAVSADSRKPLESLLKQPPAFATLALVATEEAGAKKCPPWMKKRATEVVCSASPNDVGRWIRGWFKRQGLHATPGAVSVLVKRSGGRFGATSLDHSEEEIFALTNALLARDRQGGVQALESLLVQGRSPGHILGMLAKSLKLRWALTDADSSRNDAEIAAAIKLSPRWVATARRRGEEAARDVALALWQALDRSDERLKTSAHNESLILLGGITPALASPRNRADSRLKQPEDPDSPR